MSKILENALQEILQNKTKVMFPNRFIKNYSTSGFILNNFLRQNNKTQVNGKCGHINPQLFVYLQEQTLKVYTFPQHWVSFS